MRGAIWAALAACVLVGSGAGGCSDDSPKKPGTGGTGGTGGGSSDGGGTGGASGSSGTGGTSGSSGTGGTSGSSGTSGASGAGGADAAAGAAGLAGAGQDAGDAEAAVDAAVCAAGFGDCDSNPADCETPLDTDTDCGACGRSCFGAGCLSGGLCSPTAIDPNGEAYRALLAGGNAYLMQANAIPPSAFNIHRVPTNGAAAADVVTDSTAPGGGFATDGTDIYWSNWSPSTVWKLSTSVATSGTAPTSVFQPAASPFYMEIAGGTMYWMNQYAPVQVYARSMSAPASDPGTVIVAGDEAAVRSFAVASDTIYWVHPGTSGYALRMAPLAGGTASDVPGALIDTNVVIVAEANYVYWTRSKGDAQDGVYRYHAGGSVELIAGQGVYGANSVWVDGPYAYYATLNQLIRVPKAGGVEKPVSRTGDYVQPFGSDASFIYAHVWSASKLWAIPK